jgi:CRP-like cAMP-binding protein
LILIKVSFDFGEGLRRTSIEVEMGIGKFDKPDPPPAHGPSVAATALWGSSQGKRGQLLTEDERAQLSVIASIVRFKKGMQIYREAAKADAVFNIVSGVVKAYRTLSDGSEHITAFLFADDLFGLPEEGRYSNSAKTVTPVTAYRVPVAALESRLRRDAALDFQVIAKLCHELREAQRHAILLGRRNALARVAMFLQLLEQHQEARGESTHELYLPMSRSDVADYVGMSLEAVSRSFRTLASRGVISVKGRRHLKLVDRPQFEALVLGSAAKPQ